MSRTDHHRPWQIRAEDDNTGLAYCHHSYWAHLRLGTCNERCGWTLPHCVLRHPPADYTHVVWHGPERAREQRDLRRLAQEYNANGDLEDGDFANYQARRSAHYLYC